MEKPTRMIWCCCIIQVMVSMDRCYRSILMATRIIYTMMRSVNSLNPHKAKHKLCLIDACYSGSMTNPKADFSTSINRFYSILDAEKEGTAFILSCKAREVSLEDSGLRQGIFSHYLMNALRVKPMQIIIK